MPLLTTSLAFALLTAQQSAEVPADRYVAISMGISDRLQLAPLTGNTKGKFDTSMTDVDDQQLAMEGFRCVRYVVSPADLTNGSADGSFDPKRVGAMLAAIDTAHKSGLSVIVAPEFTKVDLPTIASTLTKLGAALASTDVDTTVLEICADPLGMDGTAWQVVQESWIADIRRNMPRHTLVARSGGQDGPDDLRKTTLLADRNVVYAFQFYDPEAFTTQCLPGSPISEDDKVTLPFPATPAIVVPLITRLDDKQRDWAMRYAEDGWTADKISDIMHPVGDWARSKKVRVICDGFGVSQKVAATDRGNYLQAVKTALTNAGVGWTLTEYVGPRGVFTGVPSLRSSDAGLLAAIGMGS